MKISAIPIRSAAWMLILALCVACSPLALAHDGPEHDIQELTERIAKEGESADLLLQRAIEYQVIRKNGEAVKDLERAIELEPGSPAIQRELGRAYFSTGKTNEALRVVTRGIDVQEIESASRTRPHALTQWARVHGTAVTYPGVSEQVEHD